LLHAVLLHGRRGRLDIARKALGIKQRIKQRISVAMTRKPALEPGTQLGSCASVSADALYSWPAKASASNRSAMRFWPVGFMDFDLDHFDNETCRLEPIDNRYEPKCPPMSPA
jgi:hypothetical protein